MNSMKTVNRLVYLRFSQEENVTIEMKQFRSIRAENDKLSSIREFAEMTNRSTSSTAFLPSVVETNFAPSDLIRNFCSRCRKSLKRKRSLSMFVHSSKNKTDEERLSSDVANSIDRIRFLPRRVATDLTNREKLSTNENFISRKLFLTFQVNLHEFLIVDTPSVRFTLSHLEIEKV